MKKSYLNTVFMVVALALLATWYFVFEKKIKLKNTESADKAKQIVTVVKEDVQEITVTRLKPGTPNTYETTKLKRTGTDWEILDPVQAPADNAAVGALLAGVAGLKPERVIEEKPTDLDQYGLKNPRGKVLLKKDSTSPGEELWIGNDTPVGSGTYAKIASTPQVYKIATNVKFVVDKDAKALRNKSIWNVPRNDVNEIEIQNLKGNFVLKKNEKENWTLTRDNMPANNNEVNKLLTAITDLKATDFPTEETKNLATYGLTAPAAKIRLTDGKSKTRLGLWVGKVKDKVYVKREDKNPVYEVDKDFATKVEAEGPAFRSLELANFGRFDAKRIKLERAKDSLELVKEGTNWSLAADPKAILDNNKVDQWITAVQDSKIAKYNKGTATLAKPELTLRIFEFKDNKETETVLLKFGKAKGNTVPGIRQGLEMPFEIKIEDYKKLDLPKQAFLKVEEKAPTAPPIPMDNPGTKADKKSE